MHCAAPPKRTANCHNLTSWLPYFDQLIAILWPADCRTLTSWLLYFDQLFAVLWSADCRTLTSWLENLTNWLPYFYQLITVLWPADWCTLTSWLLYFDQLIAVLRPADFLKKITNSRYTKFLCYKINPIKLLNFEDSLVCIVIDAYIWPCYLIPLRPLPPHPLH